MIVVVLSFQYFEGCMIGRLVRFALHARLFLIYRLVCSVYLVMIVVNLQKKCVLHADRGDLRCYRNV